MKNRIVTIMLFASLIAGTAYTLWAGQPVPKAEAETASPAAVPADAIIVRK